MIRAWPIVIALLLAAACGWQGYRMGHRAAVADHQEAELERVEAGRILEEDRRRLAQERDRLARKLEESAYAEPVVVERCLAPSRVRRLNSIR